MISSKALRGSSLLKGSVSLVALTAVAAAFAAPAMAQDQPAGGTTASSDTSTEVVVVGVRRSLKTAQQIKRDADTVVDSITATDIGAFPDKSVAEALQRVAGITVSRYAASDDTAHFSAEPSGVLIRGLPQIRSEFNGRDVFSANSSRGLGWSDVSPELMSGVDTYKNETADMIEGGIAGSINLRTRLPFDSKGRLFALSVDGTYGDIAKKWEPDVSAIWSDRWDTNGGEFGAMVNAAYSKVLTGSQVIQYGRMGIFCNNNPGGDISQCSSNQFGLSDSDSAHNFAYIPSSVTYRDQTYERERKGISAAAQWQNHAHTMLATLQYNDSKYDNQMRERGVGISPFGLWAEPLGYQVTDAGTLADSYGDFQFDDQGMFESGTLTAAHGWYFASDTQAQNQALGWGGNSSNVAVNSNGDPMFYSCQAGVTNPRNNRPGDAPGTTPYGDTQPADCATGRQGTTVNTVSRYSHNVEDTADTSFNFKWDVNDKLKTNFDVQYVRASVTNYDIEVGMNSYADVNLDTTGEYPTLDFMPATAMNPAPFAGASPANLNNPNNWYYNYVMDHAENSKGTEWATRFDLQYDFDNGWIHQLRAGVRWSDRDQHVNWSTYNWKNIANTYSCDAGYYNIDTTSPRTWQCSDSGNPTPADIHTFQGYADGIYEVSSFGGDLMRKNGLLSENSFPFVTSNILESRQNLIDVLSQSVLAAKGANLTTWVPLCDRALDAPGSCYTPAEIMEIDEETEAAYLEFKFGGGDKTLWGKPVQGNFGVRYVHTTDTSTGGGIKYPDVFEYIQNNCDTSITAVQAANAATHGQYPVSVNCIGHHSIDDLAFSNGNIVGNDPLFPSKVKANHSNFLPSFNVRWDLTDNWIIRFAASRAMSRPDMGLLKNYFYVTRQPISTADFPIDNSNAQVVYGDGNTTTDTSNPLYKTACAVGQPCSYKFQYTASAGNPNLKPTTADQFDLTAENYFAQVGSFSLDLFYKKFHDYIQNGARQHVTLTNNGVSRDVLVTGPVNGDGASIKGFEVAFQRFFDFLPSPFNGLGVQTNYTHVINSGIKNAGLRTNFAGSGLGTGGGGVSAQFDSIDPGALEGVSKDSYNFVLMYEKGPWAFRSAYNWRSQFLVTASDCCVGFPVWEKANGFLDASIRYKVNDNIELSIQGSNLLATKTILLQQVDQRFTLLPNEWAQQDRRVQVGVRLKY